MRVKEYRELTSSVFDALRNYRTCATDRERNYALSVISQIAYEASLARCAEAERYDLEQMDIALKLVLELIKETPIPDSTPYELQTALH